MYELIYILKAKSTEEEIRATNEKIVSQVKGAGAEILAFQNVGKLNLAYLIKQDKVGVYNIIKFNALPEILQKIRTAFRLMAEILRFEIFTVSQAVSRPAEIREYRPVEKKEKFAAPEKREKKKIAIEELDKKLDQILEQETI